jgi:hypothetical protein
VWRRWGNGGKCMGRRGRKREERRAEEKRRKIWGRERKVGQERTEQIDIWTEWERAIGTNRLKKEKNGGNKNKDKIIIINAK